MAPAASSALESKESLIASAFGFNFFLFNSVVPRGDDLALSEGGFHTVIGRTVNGCTTSAPERPFAFTLGLGGDNKVRPRGATPAPALEQEKEGTPPIPEPQPGVTMPAPVLEQEKEGTRPNSEPRPGAATPVPVLEQEKEETPPIFEPWPEPAGPFQKNLVFPLHTPGLPRSRPQMN